MRNLRQTPSRPHMAQRVIALALLASFSACSHGGEPRHSFAGEDQQLSARAAASSHAAARQPATERSKHGVIRTSEAVPEPDVARRETAAAPAQDIATDPVTSVVPRTAATRATFAASESAQDLPDPRLEASKTPTQEPSHAQATVSSAAPVALAPVTAPTSATAQPVVQRQEPAYWPVYCGAGIAILSILAVALLRRRDRRASQAERDAELARAAEQERAAAAARDEAERLEQQRAMQAAAEAAAEEAAEQERARAAAAAASMQAQSRLDPRIEAAHRLFDLLHRAERDVEPFLRMLDEAAPHDAATSGSRQVIASWHESMLSTRNRLSEALARHNAPVDMPVVDPAPDLPAAMSRLIDHAARMSALMVAQQQENSTILHWSRQLPGALIQLFWRAQTARYTSTLPQLPKVPDTPAPGTITPAAAAPAAAARTARVRDKAIQQALRGGQSHAVRT